MTELFSTTGFVLRRRVHREADRVYTFFSRDLGKIDILSKSGSHPHAKLAPHLESFSHVRVFLVDGRGGFTLAGSDIEERLAPDPTDTAQMSLFLSGRQLTDLVTRWHEKDSWLHGELLSWMRFCHVQKGLHPIRAGFLASALGLRMVRHAGYAPELFVCLHCRRDIASRAFSWSGARGGVVCSDCLKREDAVWFRARPVTPDALKLLRFVQDRSWEDFMKIKLEYEIAQELHALIDSLIVAHFPVIPSVPIAEFVHVGNLPAFSIE